ncbi:MAG: hypothetical protein RLZZ511_115 [Cyanobacteriota bacterium]|jgi:hypothetical protein
MRRRSILQPGQSYTFSKYFELAIDTEDLLFDGDIGRNNEIRRCIALKFSCCPF